VAWVEQLPISFQTKEQRWWLPIGIQALWQLLLARLKRLTGLALQWELLQTSLTQPHDRRSFSGVWIHLAD
jgi:hypothetical protein